MTPFDNPRIRLGKGKRKGQFMLESSPFPSVWITHSSNESGLVALTTGSWDMSGLTLIGGFQYDVEYSAQSLLGDGSTILYHALSIYICV